MWNAYHIVAWEAVYLPGRKDLVWHLWAFFGNYVTNVWQPLLPQLSQAQGTKQRSYIAHALNKNVCPVKGIHEALEPGAAAPGLHRKINNSPRNAQQTHGEVYGPHNTYKLQNGQIKTFDSFPLIFKCSFTHSCRISSRGKWNGICSEFQKAYHPVKL